MGFKEKHIEKMMPHAKKLQGFLKKKGIELEFTDGDNENVVLSDGKKTIKISHHCFYRFLGISRINKQVGTKDGKAVYEYVKLTDKMFMDEYMKAIILHHFTNKE